MQFKAFRLEKNGKLFLCFKLIVDPLTDILTFFLIMN